MSLYLAGHTSAYARTFPTYKGKESERDYLHPHATVYVNVAAVKSDGGRGGGGRGAASADTTAAAAIAAAATEAAAAVVAAGVGSSVESVEGTTLKTVSVNLPPSALSPVDRCL